MSRLYISQVDACKREVSEFDKQTPSIQRCQHGYVMAAQMEFRDVNADPRWAAIHARESGEKSAMDAALEAIMGSEDVKSGLQGRVRSVEEGQNH